MSRVTLSCHGEARELIASHCNSLQLTATHCNSLQHTATYLLEQATVKRANSNSGRRQAPPLPVTSMRTMWRKVVALAPTGIYSAWLIHICAMTHAHTCHDSHTHTGICEYTLRHDSFVCVPWLIHACATTHAPTPSTNMPCGMTQSYVCHDSFTYVPWLSHTHRHLRIYLAAWRIRMCAMTHFSLACVPWLMHACAMTLTHTQASANIPCGISRARTTGTIS